MGYDYLHGRGLPKDYKKAFELLSKAAEHGDANAQTYLGSMHAEGLGVPENHAQALAWYLKAAEQGFAYAQATVGMLYLFGRGVSHDHKLAYAWSAVAAESGEKASALVLERLAPTLSPQERYETKVMSMVAIVDGGLVAVNDGGGQPRARHLGDQSPRPPGIFIGMEGTTSWREEEAGRPGLLTSPLTP